jgi:hypothetical protein
MLLKEDPINTALEEFFDRPDGTVSHLLLSPNLDEEHYLVGFLQHAGRVVFRIWPCWVKDGTVSFGDTDQLRYAVCTQHGLVKPDGWWKVDFPVTLTGETDLDFREPMQVTLLALRRAKELVAA